MDPSHWNVPSNETADSLTKGGRGGTTTEQVDRSTSYPEVKTILQAKEHSEWRHEHQLYNKADPNYILTRLEQVTVFKLRKGHNYLSYHLYSKLRIDDTEQYICNAVLAAAAVLPPLRAAPERNLARPHPRGLQAQRQSGGPTTYCHLHRRDWSFHMTNENNKKGAISKTRPS